MNDIFLSYNREDAAVAKVYAEAFVREGLDVWWDTALRSGEAYDEVTEAALRGAKAVVVLWSPRSVASRWVRAEATLADRAGTLLPVMIETCERPIMFELIQTADLSHWKGNVADTSWRALLTEVQRFVAGNYDDPTPVQLATGYTYKLPDKPSIAVLPFTDLAAAAESDYFADGIVEEISTALSHFKALFVIAGATSLTYRDTSQDMTAICRELGVRYLLEGTVRRSGSKVRINIKLNDGIAGEQVWADKFDGSLDDVFELQDRVAANVARIIDSTIENAEIHRITVAPTKSADTYEMFWRANAIFRDFEAGSINEAIALLEQVLEREPNNAWASSLAGFCHASAFSNRWTQDIWASRERALFHYDHAMRVGGENDKVLCYCAAIQVSIAGDMEIAGRLIDHALGLIPDAANTLFWGGFLDIVIGKPERGLERLEASLRVNPRSTLRPYLIAGMGICLMEMKRFDEAAVVLAEALQQVSKYPAALAALSVSLAHLGKREEAAAMRNRLMALGGMPGILAILQNPEHQEIVSSGLTLAEAGAS